MFALAIALAVAPPPNSHEADNTLYQALLDPGLVVGPNLRVKFPAPLFPDGLDAAAQKAVIVKLIGDDYSYEDFTRKSQVAPHILRIREAQPSDPKSPSRALD